ncbi:membrane protein [Dietzia sp. UCD-THP]|uniref:DUF445 domain-containing protein n=1 Tax=Dietzia natronolimnaea TaxID=161920 RepID=A0A2A2WTA4_9ACTN|nr:MULTISPECIES: DUF445 family protein [Dietzia]EYT61672.1 membrane protein [Dietzia sp. UCD-THP]PAY24214.1 DUF445 domain-containing protein [Dietzia natronolimnaea]
MKLVATGFLVLAGIIFLFAEYSLSNGAGAWAGYVRAASEAGMIGGLADWFAVTALFRHPLRIPIPHTALIPKKKDQLGASLGTFVGENFLDPEMVSEKVRSARIPARAGEWLQDEDHRAIASDQAAKAIRSVLAVLRDEDATAIIERTIVARIAEPQWGPPAGRILQELLSEGRHLPLLDLMADRTHEWVEAHPETIDRWVREKAPTWAPQFVNELLSDRAYRELREWTWQIKVDKQHAVRLALIGFAEDFARDLQQDPATMDKLETFKAEVMNREEVRRAAATAWTAAKRMIVEATEDSSSTLRVKIDDLLRRLADMLVDDEKVRARLDDYMTRTAAYVAVNYSGEVTSIISETVERWDADEASEKIELLAGKDLQFIRINGTLVGALVGLVIHQFTLLIF